MRRLIRWAVLFWCTYQFLEGLRAFRMHNAAPADGGWPGNPFNDPLWYDACLARPREQTCVVFMSSPPQERNTPIEAALQTHPRAIVAWTIQFAALVLDTAPHWSRGRLRTTVNECAGWALALSALGWALLPNNVVLA